MIRFLDFGFWITVETTRRVVSTMDIGLFDFKFWILDYSILDFGFWIWKYNLSPDDRILYSQPIHV
ncbi:hypothetical protein [Calothrix sp. NIES-3974]|uniref:hypothetical protein n=1 Tax=Calothrix sp. NIES-3974 TaxID=2005462 RepID=UPI000B613F06|nr:hypothetical protein [Calothrix sp. NIES-3974]BAZ04046.1 hypothetical protein NIES3974_06760 [Calothrix sp. NIES-3974]